MTTQRGSLRRRRRRRAAPPIGPSFALPHLSLAGPCALPFAGGQGPGRCGGAMTEREPFDKVLRQCPLARPTWSGKARGAGRRFRHAGKNAPNSKRGCGQVTSVIATRACAAIMGQDMRDPPECVSQGRRRSEAKGGRSSEREGRRAAGVEGWSPAPNPVIGRGPRWRAWDRPAVPKLNQMRKPAGSLRPAGTSRERACIDDRQSSAIAVRRV